MNWKHKVSYGFMRHIKCPDKVQRNGLRVLNYHSVGDPAYLDDMGLYNIDADIFEEHIKLLSGLNHVGINDIYSGKNNNDTLSLLVTFDDGYENNLSIVAPIMEKYEVSWQIFVVSDFIKNKKKGFMGVSELRELSGSELVTIGSHGKTHIRLSECDNKKLYVELSDSKKYLEDILGRCVDTISYPYGYANLNVIKKASDIGYELGYSSYADINKQDRNNMCLSRMPVFSYDDSNTLLQKVSGMWDWMKYFTIDPLKNV